MSIGLKKSVNIDKIVEKKHVLRYSNLVCKKTFFQVNPMAKFTFKGGIHPYDGKDLSKDKPIIDAIPGEEMVFPLSQHIGAPAKPIVKKGDAVLRGQMIAEAGGFVSAPVYSSVSGTVKSIEKRRVATGDMVESIIIQNDGFFNEYAYEKADDWRKLSRDEIISKITKAGIVGMGGAGFPTSVKLQPKEPDKIDYVIANCAECEPYLTSDYRRIIEEGEKVVEGLRIILSLFPDAHGIIGVEDNKPACIAHLKKLVKEDTIISIKELRTKYPQGAERSLIYATTGRAVNSKMLPADVGCIVNNVDTICAVYNAVVLGKPLMERIVTVTGDAVKNPRNYRVPCGMSYSEIIEQNGGFKTEPAKIICGGPMMGFAMFTTDVPVTKTSTALLAFKEDPVSNAETTPCINCSRCSYACPAGLIPGRLSDMVENFDEEAFLANGGMECCECGCCSFVCPAKKPLTQNIKSMRKMQLAKRKK